MIVINDKESWMKVTHPNIHSMYEELRNELISVPVYQEIYNRISSNISLENFMKIYDKYEIKDKKVKSK